MRTRVNFSDAAGKTVEAVHQPYGATLLLTFTDGTYAYGGADEDGDYFDDDVFEVTTRGQVKEAVGYGLLTAAEGEAEMAKLTADREAEERRERAEYDRLKAKFGG